MKALRLFIPIFIAALALGHVSAARASGGTYRFDGGTAYERSQVRNALAVSRFNWSIVPADITIHIERAVDTHSVKGNIYLDAGLLDTGQFSWGTVQDEYSHQVDFVFTQSIRVPAAIGPASSKTSLGFAQAIALGAFCNALVCLAVWLSYGAHTTADKILAVIPPIAAFVAAGFEHSVANMFFIPMGLLIKTDHSWIASMKGLPDLSHLTWGRFFADNLLPVTIGNILGGALMVGAVYWFVYLRRRPLADADRQP